MVFAILFNVTPFKYIVPAVAPELLLTVLAVVALVPKFNAPK